MMNRLGAEVKATAMSDPAGDAEFREMPFDGSFEVAGHVLSCSPT